MSLENPAETFYKSLEFSGLVKYADGSSEQVRFNYSNLKTLFAGHQYKGVPIDCVEKIKGKPSPLITKWLRAGNPSYEYDPNEIFYWIEPKQ